MAYPMRKRREIVKTYLALKNVVKTASACGVSEKVVYKCIEDYKAGKIVIGAKKTSADNMIDVLDIPPVALECPHCRVVNPRINIAQRINFFSQGGVMKLSELRVFDCKDIVNNEYMAVQCAECNRFFYVLIGMIAIYPYKKKLKVMNK